MSHLRSAALEIGHQWRMFWRSPVSAFFTVLFPLVFLVVLNLFNLEATVRLGGEITFAQFLTPGLAVFAMVTAAYTNLAISTSFDRDEGILKRILGTPLPGWAYLTGKIGAAVGIGLASVAIMLAVGVAGFDVEVVWSRLPLATLVLVVGAGAFAALGMA
ncbi:MAG: ABC transporter, partial [Actinobacteria bacterium]|nr:ABC transporter [Actinomycetota bacterium]NIS35393.1 ABC transporter [Actinomycetota bacterium]NIT98110.1 ABC transporter [Actinomycetota bacterium]NIU70085.1 ABC transporter [Actinomycetota bacterium]NIW31963.1 ABC transporter [Actinomycetota bacterium]